MTATAVAIPSGALASKLTKVMRAITNIPKSGRNSAQNYDFVTDADVMDTVRKALVAVNVATITGVTDIDTLPFKTANDKPQFLVSVKGYVEFVDGDTGESYIAEGVGQGSDSMDKGVYKAITGMTKYILLKTLLVPTGDDPERDDQPTRQTKASTEASEGVSGAAPSSGISDSQRGLIFAKFKEAGIEKAEQQAFLFDTTKKRKLADLDSTRVDTLLTALDTVIKAREALGVVEADGMPA